MTKKKNISKEDLKTWQKYIKDQKDVFDKDKIFQNNQTKSKRFIFDLHGYTLTDANKKVKEIIHTCREKNFSEVLLITGKGIHSNTEKTVYISKDLGKLRHSVPEFINLDPELKVCVSSINPAEKRDGGDGAIIIKLKKFTK